MKRAEVKIEYKWRLEDIFSTDADFEREYKKLAAEIVNVLRFTGKLGDELAFKDCMLLCDELGVKLEQMYCYAFMRKDEDGTNDKYVGMRMRAENLLVEFNSLASFITPELSLLSVETLKNYIAYAELCDYDYMLSEILRNKQHILSAREEKLLAAGGSTFGAFNEIFSMIENVDLPLPVIKVGDKKEKLTHGKYSLFLQNPEQKVRKRAFDGMYGAVKSLINTTAANFAASVKKDNFLANMRGYGSALEKSMQADNVPAAVYERLIANVHKNLDAVHDYVFYRKDQLGGDIHMYDLYVPIVGQADMGCDYEKAFDLVLKGLQPLGNEYNELLRGAKQQRWIDVEETTGKRGGAYSCGVAGVHPFVLLNYSPTTHDIFTIAHELGHAMHSYYSSKNQPYSKADYSIFVAEVASTVNEVLLLKHLINVSDSAEQKKYLLSYYLDMFRTTMFRQTMFAEFEKQAHETESGGEALTVESLSDMYLKLNKKYYGKGVKHDKDIRYEWARIPHFYTAFYVYKYATGLTSAVSIANSILNSGESAVSRYKQFLSAGGSKSPYEILCDAGVDLKSDEPYQIAADEFRDCLKQLKKL